MRFNSVPDSLAISYDGGVTYEPQSNQTRIIVKITHEKGYSTGMGSTRVVEILILNKAEW